MSGAAWAAVSGLGFGLFQSLNGRAVRGIDDPFLSTFLQLALATTILVVACVATEDVGLLADAPVAALAAVAGAGVLHFLAGWTLLNISQERLGAARTSPLLAMTPLFALALGVVTAGQRPGPAAIVAIAAMVVGATLTAQAPGGRMPLRSTAYGLGTSLCWASSPLLAVEGLDRLPSPLLGVTVGMLAAALLYGVALGGRLALGGSAGRVASGALGFKLSAAVLVGVATWLRWIALDGADAAVVMALGLLSVPVVLWLAPRIAGREHEPVTARTWAGALLVVAGALGLIADE